MLTSEVLERFEIRGRLGFGSSGTVYDAVDRQRNRAVALKVLERISPDTVARFKREFRTLASLRHANLASLYELLVLGGQWLLTMELVRGSELLEHLACGELQQAFILERVPTLTDFDGDKTVVVGGRKPKISPQYVEQVRSAFRQLAIALSVLHERGIVHRDIKPSNIMIGRDGRVVVLDFGLVVEAELDETDRRHVVGTPGYMSPEQIASMPATAASDWYSFGVLLYQALTGQVPFEGESIFDVLHNQLHIDAAEPAAVLRGVPADLSSLTHACLERDPQARPSDREILERLGIEEFDLVRMERTRERATELIGRGRELRTLRTWVDALKPGEPRIILLEGAPGVGKTALLDRFLDDLRGEGALILAGRCQPWESLQFNAADAIVDALARQMRREGSPAADEVLGRAIAVTELFPTLAAAGVVMADETISLPRGGRLVLRAAAELRSLVQAVAGDRKIVVVLDDAQWGDYQSAVMFLQLLAAGGEHRLVLVLSYTVDDWRTSLLLQALDLDHVKPKPRHLHLRELSRPMTARLVSDKKAAPGIYRRSGGNPALIQLYLEGGVESRLMSVSVAARRLFQAVALSDVPLEQSAVEESLELFEIDEPTRSLAARRLVRVRRTGDLAEIDVYHDRLRCTVSP